MTASGKHVRIKLATERNVHTSDTGQASPRSNAAILSRALAGIGTWERIRHVPRIRTWKRIRYVPRIGTWERIRHIP
jgi:hypothetical protein